MFKDVAVATLLILAGRLERREMDIFRPPDACSIQSMSADHACYTSLCNYACEETDLAL